MATRGINAKGEAVTMPAKVQRYWPGKAPKGAKDYSSSSEEEEEDQQFERQKDAELVSSIQRVEISEREATLDRRLRRLKAAQEAGPMELSARARRYEVAEEDADAQANRLPPVTEASGDEEADSEGDVAARRSRLREKALERRRQEEERLRAAEEAEKAQAKELSEETTEETTESEDSSEYETDSDDEEVRRKLLKPIFIPRTHRETVLERERQEKEAEEAEKKKLQDLEERKKNSHALLAEVIQKELDQAKFEQENGLQEIDDTDGLDEQAEYEAWKLRELMRIKRDKEEREAREMEREEIERRRNMNEEERIKEDEERVRKQREEKPKGKYRFLQKYYHKGAFYLDAEKNLLGRNYTQATPDEAVHKELLPKVMQVKNFGRAGQTKWTHLADQDTSRNDVSWSQKSEVTKRVSTKMDGIHDSFEKPTKKRRS